MSNLRSLSLLLFGVVLLCLSLSVAGCGDDESDFGPETALLDGTRDVDSEDLADLAFERARLGAEWLATVIRPDGSFYYQYDPETDTLVEDEYNEVRHAGTTYAVFQVYDAVGGDDILEAAEAAASYIEDNSEEAEVGGRAFTYRGESKLGGQALAIVALLERRRALEETSYDPLIEELATFLLAMEIEESGRYNNYYDAASGEQTFEPPSDFFPGETLLALARLAVHFPDGPYLEAAQRAAEYLIFEKDGDIPAAGQVPRQDHWLALALNELYRLDPRDEYKVVAYLQARDMIGNQYLEGDSYPERIGAQRRQTPISFTSVATKGEALVAVWSLALHAGDEDWASEIEEGVHRNIQFQMRVQYVEENAALFPFPDSVIGAWGHDALDHYIQIDFVQHNISALIGAWSVAETGDIALPSHLDDTT